MIPVPLPSASARAWRGAGLREPQKKSVRSKSKERNNTRMCRERPGRGRVRPGPLLSSPSPSLGSARWGRVRVCEERCDSEGQRRERAAESDRARPRPSLYEFGLTSFDGCSVVFEQYMLAVALIDNVVANVLSTKTKQKITLQLF